MQRASYRQGFILGTPTRNSRNSSACEETLKSIDTWSTPSLHISLKIVSEDFCSSCSVVCIHEFQGGNQPLVCLEMGSLRLKLVRSCLRIMGLVSLMRTFASGIKSDLSKRLPLYIDDWTAGWHPRVLAATLLIYFAYRFPHMTHT